MYEELKKVYRYFDDEESKMIFRQRLLYALTGDCKYIKEMLLFYQKKNKGYYDILDVLAEPELFKEKKIVLFGTGVWGRYVMFWLNYCHLECSFFCDNDPLKVGTEILGKQVISAQQLFSEHRDALVFIATEKYEMEVLQQLKENNIEDSQIIRLLFTHDQVYFDNMIVKPQEKEILIDGGCFDAKNSLDFVEWTGGNVKKIYAFEPDQNNMKRCKKNFDEKCLIEYQLIPAGLWSERTELTFSAESGQGSSVCETGNKKIAVVNIDEVVGEDEISFIKMDIEGAELQALRGAANTIKKNKPRLAICLYHKPEDILDIPAYIKELVPEYKLYIKHYYPYFHDTVLYAVFEGEKRE